MTPYDISSYKLQIRQALFPVIINGDSPSILEGLPERSTVNNLISIHFLDRFLIPPLNLVNKKCHNKIYGHYHRSNSAVYI